MVCIALSGCQATPEKDAVVNKNDNKLEAAIEATPAPTTRQMADLSRWEEDYTIPNLNCAINAEIVTPQVSAFPVYKVKKHFFDAKSTDKIVKYFTKEATGVREASPTKEELTVQLITEKRGVHVADDNGARWEPFDGQEQLIAELEEQILKAPEETFEPVTDQISPIPFSHIYAMPYGSRLHVDASEEYISISVDNDSLIQGESWLGDGGAIPGEPPGTTIKDIKISQEDALHRLESLLLDLSIKNYGIAEVEKARVVYSYTSEILSKGWQFTLTRNDGGSIPVNFYSTQFGGFLDFRSEEYVERWKQDIITVYIDETGIRDFSWSYPIEVVETLNENVTLLSFDDIKGRIKSNIKFAYSQSVQNERLSGEHENFMSVDKIVLTNVLIPIKDDLQHQMLAPAWLVYNTYYVDYEGQIIHEAKSVFAVNAIDGSNIDLSMRPRKY